MASKMKTYKNKKAPKKHVALKIIGWILLVAVISFGALAGWKLFHDSDTIAQTDDATDINTANIENNTVKPAEPNENNDKKTTQGNEAKAKTDELEKQQAKEVERNENGLKIAKVELNDPYETQGKIVISSAITNIVETEGNCNYIFTNNSTTLTKKKQVLPNAKNTICEAVVLEKASLTAGQWKVRLEYKSNYSEGVSETKTFTIQ